MLPLDAEDRSFLDAIEADRDNDMLRLVYADWLEEHGDMRCEFLRAACALAASATALPELLAMMARGLQDGDEEWVLAVAHRVDVVVHPSGVKADLVRKVRDITGWSATRAADFVAGTNESRRRQRDPHLLVQRRSHAAAMAIAEDLRALGARVVLTPAFKGARDIAD